MVAQFIVMQLDDASEVCIVCEINAGSTSDARLIFIRGVAMLRITVKYICSGCGKGSIF